MRTFFQMAPLLMAAIAAAACAGSGGAFSAESDSSEIPTVTYCDLVLHPQVYDQKTVRIRAVFTHAFEKSFLDDVVCETGKTPHQGARSPETWVDLNDYITAKGDAELEQQKREFQEYGVKDVTVVAVFNVGVPPQRFGHLGSCRFQLLVKRVESIRKMK